MVKRLCCVFVFLALIVLLSAFPAGNVTAATTCTWTGASGLWSVATNWDCGHVPQSNDDVIISTAGVTVTQDGSTANLNSLTLSSATLTTSGSFTLNFSNSGILTMTSGTISGSGDIKNVATLNWSGGTISRNGSFTYGGGVSTTANLSGTLVLNTMTIATATGFAITGGSNGSLSGTGTLNNSGTSTKDGSGTFNISGITFNNTGSVTVNTGTLGLQLKSGTSTSGTYTVASGATLSFSGAHTFNTNAKISGTSSGAGTVQFTSGTFVITSGYDLTGGPTGPAGATSLSGSASVDLSGLTLSSGHLGSQLTLGAGTLKLGTNNITLSNLDWSGGTAGSTLNGTGTVTVNTGITMSGNLTLTGATLATGSSSTTVTASGTGALSGTGTVTMTGAFTKDTASTTFTITGVTFNNTGSVSVSAGTLGIELKSGTSTSGTYEVVSGATLSFSGAHTFSSAASISGAVSNAGAVAFTGGTFTISSGYDLSGDGATHVGSTALSGGANVNLSGLALSSSNLGDQLSLGVGTLNLGSNNVTLSNLIWNGSTTGSTLSGTGKATVNTSITLSGTLTLTGYTLETGSASTTVAVNGTGTLSGTGTFTMSGALTKNTASTTFSISGITFTNTGTVTVAAGTLSVSLPAGDTTEVAAYQVNSGTFLELAVSTSYVFDIGSGISGTGTVTFSSGTFNINFDYELEGDTVISGSGTTVNFDYPIPMPATPSAGSFTVNSGAISFNGSHNFGSTADFSGTGSVTFKTGTYTIAGDYELSGTTTLSVAGSNVTINYPNSTGVSTGPFVVTGGSLTFSGSHTFNAGSDFSGAGNVSFTNGSLPLGSYTINADYTVSGTTSLVSSDVNLNFPATGSGSCDCIFDVDSASTLTITGDETFGGGFSGAGSVVFTSGTIAFDTGSSFTLGSGGSTTVSGATVGMGNLTSIGLGDSLTVSDGSLNLGSNNVTLSELTWSKGEISGSGNLTVGTTITLNTSQTLTLTGVTLKTSSLGTSVAVSGAGTLTGSGSFDLSGALTKTGTDTFTVNGIAFNNTGSVSVTAGTLKVELPVAITTNDGTYSVSSAAYLEFSASTSTTDTATIGGSVSGSGTITFTAGKVALTGGYSLTGGATLVDSADVNMSSLASVVLGNSLSLTSGSLNLGANSVSLSSLTWNGGTSGSTLSGTTGTMSVTSAISLSNTLTLTGYTLSASTSLTSVGISGTGSLSGTGVFNLSGPLIKTAAGTFSIYGITFNNNYAVNVSAGTLSITLKSADTGNGTYSVASGQTLAFSGTYTFPAGATISGAGTVEFSSGTLVLNGANYLLSGPTHLLGSSALVTINYSTTVQGTYAGNFTVDAGSTLTFSGKEVLTGAITGAGNVTFTSGIFTVGSNYTIAGTTHLSGSSAQVTINFSTTPPGGTCAGAFIVDNGSTLTLTGYERLTGSISGSGNVMFSNGSFSVGSNYALTGTTQLYGSGVSVTITYSSPASSTGPFVVDSGSTLILNGDHTFDAGADFSGTGTVDFQTGTVSVNSAYSMIGGYTIVDGATVDMSNAANPVDPGILLTLSSGSLDMGNGIFSITGMLWSGGSLTGTATISANLELRNTLNLTSGTLSANGTVTINQAVDGSLSGGGILQLNGTLTKSGAGNFTFSGIIFSNEGSVLAQGATLAIELPTAVIHNGTYAVTSGNTLQLSASTSTTDVATIGGAVSGVGTVEFTAGHMAVTSSYDLSGGGTTTVSGADLDLSAAATVAPGNTLNLTSGSLNLGNKSVTVLNATISGASSLSGTGTLTISTALTLSGNPVLDQVTLAAAGAVTVDIASNGSLSSTSGSVFNLSGTLTKSGTADFTFSGVAFNNTGMVIVSGGNLIVALPVGTSTSGSYDVHTGAGLSLSTSGTHTFNFGTGDAFTGVGSVTFTSGTFIINAGYSVSGTTTLNGTGVSVTINYPASATSSGSFVVTNGALSFSGGQVFNTSANFSGTGSISFKSGTFSIAGNYDLTGSANGTTVDTGASLSFVTGSSTLNLGDTLTINGTSLDIGSHSVQVSSVTWNAGTISGTGGTLEITGSIVFGASSLSLNTTLTVDASKTASISSSGTITGSGTINLNGTLTQSGTSTSFSISGVTFNNKGSVDLSGGTLAVTLPSGSANNGTYAVASNTHLSLTAGSTTSTITSIGGASTGGAGTVEFVSGSFAISSTIDLSGGAGSAGATIIDSGATLDVGSASTIQFGSTLTISGGTLNVGHKDITVANLAWDQGTLTGHGSITVSTSLTLTGALSLDNVSLTLGTNINIILDGNGSLTGGGTFSLNGTLTKTSTNPSDAGTFDLSGIVFDNQGTVNVEKGTLLLGLQSGASTQGDYAVSSGAFLTFSGSHTFDTGSSLTGAGTITFTSGTVVINSDYERTGETIINGATADVTVNYSGNLQSSTGKFTVTQGSLTFAGDHTFDTGADITGSGTVKFLSGTITVSSSYNLSGLSSATIIGSSSTTPTVDMSGLSGVTLGNSLTVAGGTLALGSNTPAVTNLTWTDGTLSGTASGRVTTSGSLVFNGSSATLVLTGITLQASNTSTIIISGSGTLSGTGIFNLGGTLTKSGSGTLTIDGITFNITGSGSLTVTAGTLDFQSGTYSNIAGNVTVSGGTLSFGQLTSATNTGILSPIPPYLPIDQYSYSITSGGTLVLGGSQTFDKYGGINNNGTINFQAGSTDTINIAGAFSSSGAASALNFSGGTINLNSYTYSLSLGQSLSISGGKLNLNCGGTPTVTNLAISAGELAGSTDLTINTSFDWSGGTLSRTGTTRDFGSLSLSGNLALNNGTLYAGGNTTIDIAGTDTGEIDGTGTFTLSGVQPTMTKTGTGTFTFNNAAFNNFAEFDVTEGTLVYGPLASATTTGILTIDTGATLELNGYHGFTLGSTLDNSGTTLINPGSSISIYINGNLNPTATGGSITISSGTVNINSSETVSNLGSSLTITGGMLNLSSAQTPSVTDFSLAGGGLTGSGNLTVTGNLDWSDGWMSGATGAETTTLASTGQVNFTGSNGLILDSRQFVNQGDATWNRDAGPSYLYMTNGAGFTNDTGSTFDVQGAGSYVFWGSGTFTNLGTFTDSATNTASIYGVTFVNSGQVSVTSGVLEIGAFAGSSTNSGDYSVTSPAILRFLGNSTASDTFDPSSSFTGDGTVEFRSETVLITGTYQVTGTTIVSGAHVALNSPVILGLQSARIQGMGSTLTISSGDLTFTTGNSITLDTFNLEGGRLLGTDPLTITEFNWSGGDIGNSGQTGGAITITGTFDYTSTTQTNLINRSISNQGTGTWTGTGTVYFNDASLDNTASGTLTIASGTAYAIYGGSLSNEGILNLNSGKIYSNDYTQTAAGTTNQGISGGTVGAGYCQVQVDTANLAGTLNIDFGSYDPLISLKFYIMTFNTFSPTEYDTFSVVGDLPWVLVYDNQGNDLYLWNPNSLSYIYLPIIVH